MKDLLGKTFNEPSISLWASPILFVREKDGSLHMCIDYYQLNKVTMKNKYHLVLKEYLFHKHKGVIYFTKIHLQTDYNLFRVKEMIF